jgi:hypothetical protein
LKGINQVNIWTLRGDHVFLRGWPIMTIWWGIVGDYTRIDEPKVTHYTCILFSGLIWAKVDFKRGEGSSKKRERTKWTTWIYGKILRFNDSKWNCVSYVNCWFLWGDSEYLFWWWFHGNIMGIMTTQRGF